MKYKEPLNNNLRIYKKAIILCRMNYEGYGKWKEKRYMIYGTA